MRVVILGCGRVGATLAARLDRAGHHVTVIDTRSDAFERLDPEFRGERVLGNGIDEDVLKRAGIKEADAFAAVTNGDNRNIMASQIAREIFHIKKVVCRIYDPLREQTYNEMGLETFCPTIIAADKAYEALAGHEADVHV